MHGFVWDIFFNARYLYIYISIYIYIYKFSFLHPPASVTIKPSAFKASIAGSGMFTVIGYFSKRL